MGNIYGRRSQAGSGGKYVNDGKSGGTVLRAVEDIAKLSYNDMEREFDRIYSSSNTMLRKLRDDPCQKVSARVISCLNENAMRMSRCFGAMDQYQACVSASISNKMVDLLEAYERQEEDTTPPGKMPPDTSPPPAPALIPHAPPKPMPMPASASAK